MPFSRSGPWPKVQKYDLASYIVYMYIASIKTDTIHHGISKFVGTNTCGMTHRAATYVTSVAPDVLNMSLRIKLDAQTKIYKYST